MKCIGFSRQARCRPRLCPLFNHLLLSVFVLLAQSFPAGALAMQPVVNMADDAQSSPSNVTSQSDQADSPGVDSVAPAAPSRHATGRSSAVEHFNPTDLAFVQKYLKLSDYIPVSEIKPGMEGYGLTVFQGTKVERFGVKVIGIIRKALNGRDAILIRIVIG